VEKHRGNLYHISYTQNGPALEVFACFLRWSQPRPFLLYSHSTISKKLKHILFPQGIH